MVDKHDFVKWLEYNQLEIAVEWYSTSSFCVICKRGRGHAGHEKLLCISKTLAKANRHAARYRRWLAEFVVAKAAEGE